MLPQTMSQASIWHAPSPKLTLCAVSRQDSYRSGSSQVAELLDLIRSVGCHAETKRNGRPASAGETGKMEPDVLAYRRLEALCESIRAELENDRLIADCAVFPVGIDLCSVTAPEYCQALTAAPTACA